MTTSLRLYNTLTRTKDELRPLDPSNVRMYACGPTVYDDAHIGNARPIIVFDLLFRLLRHVYGEDHVTYVRNVTDVDDKINARAAERGITIRELTDGTLKRFHEDIRGLGVLMPEDAPGRMIEPRATDHVEEMKQLIERLLARGHAYVAEEHVLFHVPSMADYGGLSRRPLDEMEAGARVDVAPYKRSPLDFVLWKPSGERDPAWPSPAGIATPGRPGWHIECSAMAWKNLGETFDIHAGGIDLVFPHHENEVAQSRCSFGHGMMASIWMHNGFLQVEGDKMSKSLGNFVTIRELLTTDSFGGRSWPGEVLRLAMLRTHYRQPIDWTVQALEEAEAALRQWHDYELSELPRAEAVDGAVREWLADDLNTPAMLSAIHGLRKTGQRTALGNTLAFLGLYNPARYGFEAQRIREDEISPENRRQIETWITGRAEARKRRDFAESDRIRDELASLGVVLKDNKDGTTTWEIAR